MPHLVIEITENVRLTRSQDELLDEANAALLATGHFDEPAIKSRCHTLPVFRVGTAPNERAFVHCTLSILDGRELAIRQLLGKTVCDAVAEAVRPGPDGVPVQITVDVRNMERASFAKRVIEG